MWCPVCGVDLLFVFGAEFRVSDHGAPWFNGLVTPACGFIVFVNLVSRGGCHLRGSLFALELEFMQARVNASHCQQLGVIPALDNLSIVHDEDYIGGTDRRQMMCDHD